MMINYLSTGFLADNFEEEKDYDHAPLGLVILLIAKAEWLVQVLV